MLHRADNADLLSVSKRELFDFFRLVHLQPFAEHLRLRAAVHPAHFRRQRDHVAHPHVGVEPCLRGHVTHLPKDLHALGFRIHPEELCLSLLKPRKPEHGADGRGLSGAVWPKKSKNLSFLHRQGKVRHTPVFPIILCQIFNLNDILSHTLSSFYFSKPSGRPLLGPFPAPLGYCFLPSFAFLKSSSS